MLNKGLIRKKYYLKRKKNYFTIKSSFFNPIINLIKKKCNKKNTYISLYYPSSYEVDVTQILENKYFKNFKFLMPIVEEENSMSFHKWEENDILNVNKFGIPEPLKTAKKVVPAIIFVPLIAFDNLNNRLGYGKGFYDKFLLKYRKINRKILSIGIAFSFQKYHKLPTNSKDVKLDYIITEKGIVK